MTRLAGTQAQGRFFPVEVMQRYSNLDIASKTLRKLHASALITPDGSPVHGSGRSCEKSELAQPFKLDQRLKPETVAEIVARYEAGEPSTALASTFAINKNSVIKLLREADVPIRKQGLTNDQIAEAVQLYASGQSLAKIGTHLAVDHGAVWRQLRKRGVKMRDSHSREMK
jgi:hypothetical protein